MTKKNAGTAVISSTAAQKTFLEYASSMEYDRYQMEKMIEHLEAETRQAGQQCTALTSEKKSCQDSVTGLERQLNTDTYKVSGNSFLGRAFKVVAIMFGLVIVESIIGFGILSIVLTPLEAVVGTNGVMAVLFLGIPGILAYSSLSNEADEKNKGVHEEQQKAINTHNKRITEIDGRIGRLKNKVIPYYERETARCKEELRKLNLARARYYEGEILHKKYRNAAATGTMLEYLETRRCDQIEGHGGTIDVFEQELYLKKIVLNTESISRKLDQVILNQGKILNRIEQIDQKVDGIMQSIDTWCSRIREGQEKMKRSLDQIEYNSRLTGYYAEVTARSAKYLAWKQGYGYHRYIV